MSLHDELADTARFLLRRNQNRPTQADLRRCISTAYYALFHRLIDDCVGRLVAGAEQRDSFARAFNHGEMREVCERLVRKQKEPVVMVGLEVPDEVKAIASLFVQLQEDRHDADYNRRRTFVRDEAKDLLAQLAVVLHDWERVRATAAGETFLLLLLLGKRVGR